MISLERDCIVLIQFFLCRTQSALRSVSKFEWIDQMNKSRKRSSVSISYVRYLGLALPIECQKNSWILVSPNEASPFIYSY